MLQPCNLAGQLLDYQHGPLHGGAGAGYSSYAGTQSSISSIPPCVTVGPRALLASLIMLTRVRAVLPTSMLLADAISIDDVTASNADAISIVVLLSQVSGSEMQAPAAQTPQSPQFRRSVPPPSMHTTSMLRVFEGLVAMDCDAEFCLQHLEDA